MGGKCFSGCSSLTSVTIGSGVNNISDYAFENCSSLSEVTCLADTVPNANTYAFLSSPIEQATLYVPASALTAYQTTKPWSDFGTIKAIAPTSINPTPMRGTTVQSVHGFVTITGLAEYEHISYYSAAGAYLGRAESIDGTATFTAPANTIVVVKIGTRSIKVNVR